LVCGSAALCLRGWFWVAGERQRRLRCERECLTLALSGVN